MALVVFTGGARSGKSSAAQQLARVREIDGAFVTVAVFGRKKIDAEFESRIDAHRSDRPEGWTTLEAQDSRMWMGEVTESDLLLVDCLGTWMGIAMEEAFTSCAASGLGAADAAEMPVGFDSAFAERAEPVIEWLLSREADTIVVSNEVGDGVVPTYASGRFFRDELARANRRLVSAADSAYLAVCGRLLDLSALPIEVAWPED
jgi:adenosylcobinamide kinase/adenosylcobinamide-phosphate guanylyltransferase